MRRAYVLQASQAYVGQFLESFKEYPQRQKAATFNLDDVMEQMKKPGGG
jgi:arylsulfatase